MKKRMLSIMMCLGIAASLLVGCQTGEEGTKTTAAVGAEEGKTEGTQAAGEEADGGEELPTITIMSIDGNGNALGGEDSDKVIQMMEEHTGVKADITWVASDSYTDKLGVTLLDKENLPMIITIDGNLNTTVVSAARAGAFYDLNDYIFDEEKYPNLSKANPEILKALTVDGQLIGIYRARPIGRNGLAYRKDWADKLGLAAPATIDDFYEMAYQFTYGAPDGNGQDDTYGLCMCSSTGPFNAMQTWFGVGNGWVEQDGKMMPVFYQDEYKEALEFFRKMYEEGLFYKDWAVRDTSSWRDGCTKGECGMWLDVLDGATKINSYFSQNGITGVNGEEMAYMEYQGAVARDAESEPKTIATSGMGGFFVITKAADTPEKLEACLTFLDRMNDEEMLIVAQYGLEGIQWEKDEATGEAVILDAGENSASKANNGMQQLCCFIPNRDPQTIPLQMPAWEQKEKEVISSNEQYAVYNPATEYLANSNTYTTNGANLDMIIEDARTQYICGQIDWDGFLAAVSTWEQQGGNTLIDEVNSLYSAK